MTEFDIRFDSLNSENHPKPITAYVVPPKRIGSDTGLLHFAHGWGGNRFQYREMQREFAESYDLVCVATEYRMSGFDFDPVTGRGAYRPYDASHLQVVDCLNAVRAVLNLFPTLNRDRLMAFGGSQGGHVTMLMAIFAPDTFALAISGSGISHMDAARVEWTGRDMSADELAVRDCVAMADRVTCPVVLMHGTADTVVPDSHTRLLEKALRNQNVELACRYVDGGGHGLEPVTSRRDLTVELADDWLRTRRCTEVDAFAAGRRVEIPCRTRSCVIDWSRAAADPSLLQWL